MKYACRARKIEKVVHQNVKAGKNAEQLKKEVTRLKRQLQMKQSGIPRSQMQEFIQKLIKNVETLTILRCKESGQLTSKMREIELIEEQSKIVSSMLHKCEEEPEEMQVPRCNTIQVRQKRKRKASTAMEIQQIISCPQEDLNSFKQGPKSNVFVRGNLENARVKHKR